MSSLLYHIENNMNVFTELGEWVTIPTTYAGGAKSMFVIISYDFIFHHTY